jgi:hypothetical protein
MPDRFLSYLIEGQLEGMVLPPGAIAAHERAQALGCVAAVQLLAEGAPLASDIAMRARRLLRVLAQSGRDPRRYALLRDPGPAERFVDVDELALPFDPIDVAIEAGMQAITDVPRLHLDLPADALPRSVNAGGIDLTLRTLADHSGAAPWLELELLDAGSRQLDGAAALLWSQPGDLQRSPFDLAGVARLRWPTNAQNTLRIDVGPRAALIDLHATT